MNLGQIADQISDHDLVNEKIPDVLITAEITQGSEDVFGNIKKMRAVEQLSDVTICVGGNRFKLHKFLLAASSEYFKTMFSSGLKEENEHEVAIEGVTLTAFRICVDYIYFDVINVTEEYVPELLQAVDYLGLETLMLKCAQELERNLKVSNCVNTYQLSIQYKLKWLETVAKFMLMEKGNDILNQDVGDIPLSTFKMMLFSDELNLLNESVAFDALVKWVKKDEEHRKEYFCELLEKVRLPLISNDFFTSVVTENKHIKFECDKCKGYMWKTMLHFVDGEKHNLKEEQLQSRSGTPNIILFKSRYETYKLDIFQNEVNNYRSYELDTHAVNLVYFKNKLYKLEQNSRNWSMYDCSHDKTWTEMSPIPRQRGLAQCMACIGDEIYVIGGKNSSNQIVIGGYGYNRSKIQNQIDCFNVKTNMWQTSSNTGTYKIMATAVVLDRFIYVIGGKDYNANISSSVEKYDLEKWVKKPSLNIARYNHASAVFNGKIFVAGGENNGRISSVETYAEGDAAWTKIADLNVPRSSANMFVYWGRLFILGGSINSSLYEEFIEAEGKWRECKDIKDKFGTCKVFLIS